MIKVYKRLASCNNSSEIIIINFDNGDFTSYKQDKTIGFTYGLYKTNIKDMGYKSIDDCIKALKYREFLGKEIDYKEQKQSEKQGLINLGVYRIKRNNRINTTDFEDVIEKLSYYGLGYCDAQNIIIATYQNTL